MRSLVYGIDGGDRRILEHFEMPFYRHLSSRFTHLELREDLLNRGWSEIITGATGKDTGGFYMAPELDGTPRMSMKYQMDQVPKRTSIKLIWDKLPAGTRSGVMNVPSLLPVTPLNGFCVGSAGAGIFKIEQISSELAYPTAAQEFLQRNSYVPDIRLNTSEINDPEDLFAKLKVMEKTRVECYINLAKEFSIDFGLLIDRGTTVIQYLFMSEICAIISRDRGSDAHFQPTPQIEDLLHDYYTFLDKNIETLYSALAPEQFILVSDHGHEPMMHHCNPNHVLAQHGLYTPLRATPHTPLSHIKSALRPLLPWRYRKKIRQLLSGKNTPKGAAQKKPIDFDTQNTKAFSYFHVPGIYINDQRFNGPVSDEESRKLVPQICRIFNDHPDSKTHGIEAIPYREHYLSHQYSDKLPDIRLHIPDTMFTTCLSDNFVFKNPTYGPVPNFNNVVSEMHTGTKGARPLCLVDPTTAKLVQENDIHDLTLVYKLIDRHFS